MLKVELEDSFQRLQLHGLAEFHGLASHSCCVPGAHASRRITSISHKAATLAALPAEPTPSPSPSAQSSPPLAAASNTTGEGKETAETPVQTAKAQLEDTPTDQSQSQSPGTGVQQHNQAHGQLPPDAATWMLTPGHASSPSSDLKDDVDLSAAIPQAAVLQHMAEITCADILMALEDHPSGGVNPAVLRRYLAGHSTESDMASEDFIMV